MSHATASPPPPAVQKIDRPWFIVGCVMLIAALVAFFWAFSIDYLSPSRRFLLMWLLPLSSAFACGCFAGSLKASGPLASLAIAATGGFAVWILSFFLLPHVPDQAPPPEPKNYVLAGTIWGEHDEPVTGVLVSLTDIATLPTSVTDKNGRFDFQITATNQIQVRLVARKEGYEIYRADPTIGNAKLEFKLHKKP